MRKAVVISILTLMVLSVSGQEKWSTESARPNPAWRANYEALEDDRLKELLPEAIELLEATRTLPDTVDLWAEEEPKGEAGSRMTEEERGWVTLVDSPAVPLERLAHACLRAKRFEHAGELYSELIEENPDEKHYQMMWFICQRLLGVDVETITQKMTDRGLAQPQQEWLEWARNVDRLHMSLEGGEKE